MIKPHREKAQDGNGHEARPLDEGLVRQAQYGINAGITCYKSKRYRKKQQNYIDDTKYKEGTRHVNVENPNHDEVP
jgi:hypothetical protein